MISNLKFITPFFGDHKLVTFSTFSVRANKLVPLTTKRRDWRAYSKEKLNVKRSLIDWSIGVDDVQEYWNVLENKLINIVDEIVPLKTFELHVVKEITPKFIQNKINKRNRLLKCFLHRPNIELKTRISNLNFEIRTHFFTKKRFNVRKGILPNNSKSLWQAVKVAKNGYSARLAKQFIEYIQQKV